MDLRAAVVTLALRHPFGLSRGTATALPTALVRLGDRGVGEGAPVRYLGHAAADVARVAAALAGELGPEPPDEPRAILAASARARRHAPDLAPARAAVDIALWDAAARRRGAPLAALLAAPDVLEETGLSGHVPEVSGGAGVTSYTVALAEPAAMAARAEEAADLPVLKVKLGRGPDHDRAALRAVAAAAPRARLRVDANGGWTLDDARALLPALADLGVEHVEQPLARGQLAALAQLARGAPLPIYADEDAQGADAIAGLRGLVTGINVKLMKCGGISPALAMIAAARRAGMRVLLGCMIESRVGLAAAAQLAAFADEADLDAHMLTRDDPVPPGSQAALTPALPLLPGPGLGIPPTDLDRCLEPARVV